MIESKIKVEKPLEFQIKAIFFRLWEDKTFDPGFLSVTGFIICCVFFEYFIPLLSKSVNCKNLMHGHRKAQMIAVLE